jgi:hypothetical protein
MWIAAGLSSRKGCRLRGSCCTPITIVSWKGIGVELGIGVGEGISVGAAGVTVATTTIGPGLPHALRTGSSNIAMRARGTRSNMNGSP